MHSALKPTLIVRNNPRPLMPPSDDEGCKDDSCFWTDMAPETLRLRLRLHRRKIKTGCKDIDNVLTGGIPVNGIVEIYGESSCGKTQICLQLSIVAQYPEEMGGLNAGVVYICTEDAFPSKRLSDLCEEFVKHMPKLPKNIDFKNNVYVIHVYDLKQFEMCLFDQVPKLISKMKIGLIIIDSIAGVFRYDCDIPWLEKWKIMRKIARKLHSIIDDDYVAVVCANQVTTQFENDVSTLVPSLGESWGQYVMTRIQLERSRGENNLERTFRVTIARDFPRGSCKFTIQPHGIL